MGTSLDRVLDLPISFESYYYKSDARKANQEIKKQKNEMIKHFTEIGNQIIKGLNNR